MLRAFGFCAAKCALGTGAPRQQTVANATVRTWPFLRRARAWSGLGACPPACLGHQYRPWCIPTTASALQMANRIVARRVQSCFVVRPTASELPRQLVAGPCGWQKRTGQHAPSCVLIGGPFQDPFLVVCAHVASQHSLPSHSVSGCVSPLAGNTAALGVVSNHAAKLATSVLVQFRTDTLRDWFLPAQLATHTHPWPAQLASSRGVHSR